MLIKYNGTNVHALALYSKNRQGYDVGVQSIKSLRPGWNEFPTNIWKMYEKDAEIMRFMKEGKIEVMPETITVKGKKVQIYKGDEELSLHKMPEDMAIDVVKATYNRDMLQRWVDEETRHKVKRAIEKQIEPLLPENKTATS